MHILLVEDDQRTADFIIKGLKQADYTVEHCSDGHQGLKTAANITFDAIIMDIMLPKLNGLSVIQKLRNRDIKTPIIVLSAKKEVDERISGLQAGADDYLIKPFSFSELLARLQTITRRRAPQNSERNLKVADLSLDIVSHKVTRNNKHIEVQPKEYALLEYLMRNHGNIVSKVMIMENVWEFDFDPQTNIVESRVCRLREKIDKGFEPKLIHTVRGVGYVLKEK